MLRDPAGLLPRRFPSVLGSLHTKIQFAALLEKPVRDVLPPEVEQGVLTPAEVDVLSGGRKQCRKLLHSVHGHHTRQIVKHVIHARTEVARVRAGG